MSDSPQTPGTPAEPPTAPQTAATSAAPAWTPPAAPQDPPPPTADRASDGAGPATLAAERPEIAVGAAFAGGLVFALILKRLAR